MDVRIYTKSDCSYCTAAKTLMRAADVLFIEQVLDVNFTREQLKEKYPSATMYPVIVVDGFFVGGYNELKTLVEQRISDSKQLLNEG